MNVSYVYHTDWDPARPHGKQIIHTINGLANQENKISLFTPAAPNQFLDENQVDLNANIQTLPTARVNAYAGRFDNYSRKYIDQFTYYMFATFASVRQDLIFTRDFRYLKFLQYLPSSLYPPVLYEAHQCYSGYDEFSKKEEYTRLQEADRIITQSPGVAKDIRALGIEVAEVIPNAAPQSFVPEEPQAELRDQYGFNQESTVIIYAGSFSQWKNDLELVVDAVSKLVTDDTNDATNIELAFVGGTDEEVKELAEYCNTILPDSIRCHLFGRVPHRSVFRYLKAADIGVIPLRKTSQEATEYTCPIKLFEYLVSGLPVVSSNVPSINLLCDSEDPVSTYTPGDSTAFAQAVRDAMKETSSSVETSKYTYENRAKRLNEHLQATTSK
ncbi:glycosyltransferase [Salinarchaeum sp. IM2453]|uniref:glycosyltransferase n=1 Tax=Salinarchaeum sp. IM2453 TaxID=2862870 RepID=UPI001C834671|nr:glycosyltransferase [Salinarchaeum sp. IM2453]QZA89119.1 glycosyltransferase [Salinarchaeum sp. IM2453]